MMNHKNFKYYTLMSTLHVKLKNAEEKGYLMHII